MTMYSGPYETEANELVYNFISNTDSAKLYFLEAVTNTKQIVEMLLDSGSTSSLIRQDVADKFHSSRITNRKHKITVANGETISTLGTRDLNLTFNNSTFGLNVTFRIVKDLPVAAIIGNNVLDNMILDLHNKRLVDTDNKKVFNIKTNSPGVHSCDFTQVSDSQVQLNPDVVHKASMLQNPAIYDMETKKIIPIEANGKIFVLLPIIVLPVIFT